MQRDEIRKEKLAKQDSVMRYGDLMSYFSLKTRAMHIPFSGTFELTPRCNMNCKMCYIRMDEEEMKTIGRELTADEWIRLAEEAVKEGMTMILLTGGEAILHKEFKKLYLALRKMGLFISINSNATMLTDKWVQFFRENPPAKINITIYGGSNETYERLCGNPRGFDQLKNAVDRLQEAHISILLNCMITKQNEDDMELMYQFAESRDLKLHPTSYAFPPVRKEGVIDPALDRFDAKTSGKTRVLLDWRSMGEHDFRIRAHQIATNLGAVEPVNDCGAGVEGDKVRCAAGRGNFWITWDGRMLPCGMLPGYSVPVRERPFKEAWDEVVAYTDQITLAPECAVCPKQKICFPCAARTIAESGSYHKKPEYMCQVIDEYIRLMTEADKYFREHEETNR